MGATHDLSINVDIALGPPPGVSPGFRVLVLVALATNSLDGDDFRSYASISDVNDDEADSYISAATAVKLRAVLAQRPQPDLVYVGAVDLVGTETYPQALARIDGLLGDNFFFVTSDAATAAIHVAISLACEQSGRKVYIFQSDDADWLTATLPTDYAALAGREQTLVVYNDDPANPHDTAAAGAYAGPDPALRAVSPARQLRGIDGLDDPITAAQRLAIFGNSANVVLPFSTAQTFIKNGRNCAGRALNEIIAREFITREITRRIGVQALRLQPGFWPLDNRGQALLESVLRDVGATATAAGHIVRDQLVIELPNITTADRDAGRLRGSFIAQVGTAVVRWDIDGTLDREPVITEEG